MTNLNPIAATKIAAGSQPAQPLQGSGSGVLTNVSGASFFDLIIAKLAVTSREGVAAGLNETKAPAQNAAKSGTGKADNPLAMLQVALAAQNLDADGNIVVTPAEADPAKLQGQLDLTNQIINHLKNVLPENAENDGVFAKLLAKLQAKSETLQASLSALENGVLNKDTPVEDIPMPLMIALGLKPSEIAEVSDKIQQLQKKLGREITVEDLIAGIGGIVPPAPETTIVAAAALPTQIATTPDEIDEALQAIDAGAEPTDDLAAKLNALNVGGEEIAPETDAESAHKMEGLPVSDDVTLDNAKKPADAAPDAVVKKPAADFREHLVNLLNGNNATQGDMLFPVGMFGGDADAAIFQQYGMAATPSLSLGTTAQAANMIATSAAAGQAHPATNMVAAQIVKFAANGTDDQTMNIRLDPPELGNVSVRLQFGKDKTVKAVVTAEKPETFLMLQRDAHSLERALQHAGLDAKADSISFQLAQDNGAFAHDNSGGANDTNFGNGGNDSGAQDAGTADEIIQSSVTWQVDPSTGHVRYNIFA